MNNGPCLEIHVYSNDSHVSRFVQKDPAEAALLIKHIQPERAFAQHNLVVKSGFSLSVFQSASVARIDFIMDGHPDWSHHHNIELAIQIGEAEFDGEYARAQLASQRGDRTASTFAADAFAELTLANADRLFAKFVMQSHEVTAADSGINMQHVFDAPCQYLRRQGGGAILINSANIARLRVFPGPTHIPSAWHAEVA